MKNACFSFLILCAVYFNGLSASEGELETGTIIVSYRTDKKGERLDRIRFCLKDKEGLHQALYPKGKAFLDDPQGPSRLVVLEGIPTGDYILSFLVPNTDNFFQKVPPREISLINGEIVKIDQQIKAALKIEEIPIPQAPPALSSAEKAQEDLPIPPSEEEKSRGNLIVSFTLQPAGLSIDQVKLHLIDSKGLTTIHPDHDQDVEVSLQTGKMLMIQNIPEDIYTIEFYSPESKNEKPLLKLKDIKVESNGVKSIHETLTFSE